jgi:hypothetical protein
MAFAGQVVDPVYGSSGGAPGPQDDGLFNTLLNQLRGGKEKIRAGVQGAAERPGGMVLDAAGNIRKARGGRGGAAFGALETTLQDPVAGIISAPIGLGAGMLANTVTNALTQGMMASPHPGMKLAGSVLRFAAPAYAGYAGQQAAARGVQGALGTGQETVANAGNAISGSAGGLFGLGSNLQDLTLPIIGPVGERAKRRAESAYQRSERAEDVKTELALEQRRSNILMNQNIAEARAINQIQTDAYLNQMRGVAPLLLDQLRQETTAKQALMNTQGAINQKLARLAGTFDLAGRSLAETGAYARTVAATSPLNAPLMEGPQISFG